MMWGGSGGGLGGVAMTWMLVPTLILILVIVLAVTLVFTLSRRDLAERVGDSRNTGGSPYQAGAEPERRP